MDPNQFRDDREIDPHQLDVECIRQAERTYHWAQASVEASAAEDRAKFQFELVQGRLEMEARQHPERFGLTKITDPGIKAAVRIHKSLIAAYDDWIEAKKQSRLLNAAVNAMEVKKRMLQGLISLHGQQYFAGPDVPRDLVGEWKDHQDRTEQSVNKRQRKRTRRGT